MGGEFDDVVSHSHVAPESLPAPAEEKTKERTDSHAEIGGTWYGGNWHSVSEGAQEPAGLKAGQYAVSLLRARSDAVSDAVIESPPLSSSRINSEQLTWTERITRFAKKLFRGAMAEKIHKNAKQQAGEIVNDSKRQRITDELQKCYETLQNPPSVAAREQASERLDFLNKVIKSEVKAQQQTAGVSPVSKRADLTERLAAQYLEKEEWSKEQAGNEGFVAAYDQELLALEGEARLELPPLSSDDSREVQLKSVEDKLRLVLANREKLVLWNALYDQKVEKYTTQEDAESARGQFDHSGLTHPKHMTKETFNKYSQEIDHQLDKKMESSEFEAELKGYMEALKDADDLYESAQDQIVMINKQAIDKDHAPFLADIQALKGQKIPQLLQLLFPLRGKDVFSSTKEDMADAANKRQAITGLVIFDFVPSLASKPDRQSGIDKKPGSAQLGKVDSFNLKELEKRIQGEKDRVEDLKKQHAGAEDKVQKNEIARKIAQAELEIASNDLKKTMQEKMVEIHKQIGKIPQEEVEANLRELHSEILEGYDRVRNKYTDAPLVKTLEQAGILSAVTLGGLPDPQVELLASNFSSSQISQELAEQMWLSMGLDQESLNLEKLKPKDDVKAQETSTESRLEEEPLLHHSKTERLLRKARRTTDQQKMIHEFAKINAAAIGRPTVRRDFADALDDCYTKLAQGQEFTSMSDLVQHIEVLKDKERAGENPAEVSAELLLLEQLNKQIEQRQNLVLPAALQVAPKAVQREKVLETIKDAMFNQIKATLWKDKGTDFDAAKIDKEAEDQLNNSSMLKEYARRLSNANDPVATGKEIVQTINDKVAEKKLRESAIQQIEGNMQKEMREGENIKKLKHEVHVLKEKMTTDLSEEKTKALKLQLYPLVMKLTLYEGIHAVDSRKDASEKEVVFLDLHSRLIQQNAKFKEKFPGLEDYGDVSTLLERGGVDSLKRLLA